MEHTAENTRKAIETFRMTATDAEKKAIKAIYEEKGVEAGRLAIGKWLREKGLLSSAFTRYYSELFMYLDGYLLEGWTY